MAALTPFPSGRQRIALALGFPGGYTAQGYADLDMSGWGVAYVVILSVLTEAVALLTLGPVQRSGEAVPRSVPFIGDWVVSVKVAMVPALTGAGIRIVLWTPMPLWWHVPHELDMARPVAKLRAALQMAVEGVHSTGDALIKPGHWLATWSFDGCAARESNPQLTD